MYSQFLQRPSNKSTSVILGRWKSWYLSTCVENNVESGGFFFFFWPSSKGSQLAVVILLCNNSGNQQMPTAPHVPFPNRPGFIQVPPVPRPLGAGAQLQPQEARDLFTVAPFSFPGGVSLGMVTDPFYPSEK